MRIAVIGCGAIGSVLGARLSDVGSVTVIGHQSPHIDALRTDPVTVIESDGSRHKQGIEVSTNHDDVAGVDLIVLAVKSYDTAQALEDVESIVESAPILTLQNGLGNVEQIRDTIAPKQVIGGTTTMGAQVTEPGTVQLTSVGDTRIGRPWGKPDDILGSIKQTFEKAGFPTVVTEHITRAIWEKVLLNVGINPVTALAGVPNGRLQSGPGRALMESAIEEANAVAKAEGFNIDTPVSVAVDVVEATADNYSSMLRDVEAGSRTEIDALNGAIVDRANKHGIDVPINRTLTNAIRLKTKGKGSA